MAISKQKVIVALIPFLITTLGIGVFLIFFNFSTITFEGESPFTVQTAGSSYNDTNGKVELYIRSGNYKFTITKPEHFEQQLAETLLWKESKNVSLTFTYKPNVTTKKFVPAITYTGSTAVIDNQTTDLLFATLSPKEISLPAEYNRVVWSQDGTKACLFATQNSALAPKLWSNAIAKNLPSTTFDCYATTQGLFIAQIEEQKLVLNGKAVDFFLPENFSIAINTPGQYMTITEKGVTSSMDKVTFINLATKKSTDLGNFSLAEPVRFIGLETIALVTKDALAIYHPSFSTIKTLPAYLSLARTLTYDAKQETFYYVGSEDETTTSILPSLNEFGINTSSKAAILSFKTDTKKNVYSLPEGSQFTKGIVSADQKQIAFYAPETNDLILVELTP